MITLERICKTYTNWAEGSGQKADLEKQKWAKIKKLPVKSRTGQEEAISRRFAAMSRAAKGEPAKEGPPTPRIEIGTKREVRSPEQATEAKRSDANEPEEEKEEAKEETREESEGEEEKELRRALQRDPTASPTRAIRNRTPTARLVDQMMR